MAQTRRRSMPNRATQARQSFADYIKMAVVVAAVVLAIIGVKQLAGILSPDSTYTLKGNTFLPGIYVYGTDLGGLTLDEGTQLMQQQMQQRFSTPIRIRYQDREWTVTPADLDAKVNLTQQLGQAFNFGNVGSAADRRDQAQYVKSEGRLDFDEQPTFDEAKLDAFISGVKAEVDVAPVDAQVVMDVDGPRITADHKNGTQLDAAELRDKLEEAIKLGASPEIELSPHIWAAGYTREMAERATQLIAWCTTDATSSTEERNKNIKRALRFFDGMVVQPDEEVSFNDVVGKRTLENKFFEAPEFQEGELVTGIGGGTCQASTTLYVALRRAGLAITERHPHSQLVPYTDPSLDATVTDNGKIKDLRFINDTDYPIYISTSVTWNKATVKIYGMKPEYDIAFVSRTIETTAPRGYKKKYDTRGRYVTSPDDEPVLYKEGKDGKKTRGIMIYSDRETGEIIREESVSLDEYAPVQPTMWVYYDPDKKK